MYEKGKEEKNLARQNIIDVKIFIVQEVSFIKGVQINPKNDENRANGIKNEAKGRTIELDRGLTKISLLKYIAIIGSTLKEAARDTIKY